MGNASTGLGGKGDSKMLGYQSVPVFGGGGVVGFPNSGGLCSVSQAQPQTPDTELAFASESGRWVSFRWVLDVWPSLGASWR